MLVYMDPNNETDEKIRRKLWKINCTRYSYLFFLLALKLLEYFGLGVARQEFTDTIWFSWLDFILRPLGLIIRVYVYVSLIKVGFRM